MNEEMGRSQLEELARKLAAAVPKNLRALGDDLEKNFKSLLSAGFERMDLVTREEFDLQAAVLERTREKLEALAARIAALEGAGPD
jgi:BMFP domain-containing protein YqiC